MSGASKRKRRLIAALVVLLSASAQSSVAQGGPFVPSVRPNVTAPDARAQRNGVIFSDGAGKVVGFLDRAESQSMRLRTDMMLHGLSEPGLRDKPRAVIEVLRPQGRSREIAVVPDGMSVAIGDTVEFDAGY